MRPTPSPIFHDHMEALARMKALLEQATELVHDLEAHVAAMQKLNDRAGVSSPGKPPCPAHRNR